MKGIYRRLSIAIALLLVAALDVSVLQSDNATIELSGIPGPYAFHRFCRSATRQFWAVGGDGSIHSDSWDGTSRHQHPTKASLNAVCFVGSGSGWVAGESGVVLHTTDWGDHWVPQRSGVTQNLQSAACIDDLHCWLVGTHGTVLVTDDAGVNWARVRLPVRWCLYAVYFLDK